MESKATSISVGLMVATLLNADEAVSSIATKVFPVAVDAATLPYVVYRCVGMGQEPQKGIPGADTVDVEVCCCAADYAGSVALAEAVRSALDRRQFATETLRMRKSMLTGREETYEDDAYVQVLTFSLGITGAQHA